MTGALQSKQVAAISVLDPWVTQITVQKIGHVLSWLYIDSIPEQPTGAWFARASFIKTHREAIDRFRKAIHESIDYMNADPDRARKNVAAYTKLSPDLVKTMPLNRWIYKIDLDKWQKVADLMTSSGELQRSYKATEFFSDLVKSDIAR
jgi:NitT/TauT family transport system substrate-binding protein